MRAFRLHGLEALLAALEQDADEVDHHVGAAHRGLDRSRIAKVRLHRVDLPDAAERLEMTGEVRPPHGRAHPVALARERAHHVAAEEARAAEHGDQRFCGDFGHGTALGRAKRCCGRYSAPRPAVSSVDKAKALHRMSAPPQDLCPGGGIGRRAGFRCQWPKGCEGSSPFLGTIPFPILKIPAP